MTVRVRVSTPDDEDAFEKLVDLSTRALLPSGTSRAQSEGVHGNGNQLHWCPNAAPELRGFILFKISIKNILGTIEIFLINSYQLAYVTAHRFRESSEASSKDAQDIVYAQRPQRSKDGTPAWSECAGLCPDAPPSSVPETPIIRALHFREHAPARHVLCFNIGRYGQDDGIAASMHGVAVRNGPQAIDRPRNGSTPKWVNYT